MIIKFPFLFKILHKQRGITLFPFIFIKYESDVVIVHERVHLQQQKELFIIGFYILYTFYFLKELIKVKNFRLAYINNPFEREAYFTKTRRGYLKTREKYSWVYFIT